MFQRKRSEEDFAEEIRAHLALEADELRGEGVSEDEAYRRSRSAFGSVSVARERFHMRSCWVWLDKLGRDLRFSLRALLKSPGFALTAIMTLALGVGANTAVFSVMNAVLLRSLPVADAARVVYLRTSKAPMGTGTIDENETFSYPVYSTLRREAKGLSEVIGYVPLSGSKVAVRIDAAPEVAEGDMVSGNFFSGLGVKIIRGRGFSEQDETNHAPIAVISYRYWTRRFGRDPGVLGKAFYVNRVAMTIVGVSADGFEGAEGSVSTDFWIPLQNRPELNAWGNPLENGKNYVTNQTWWCMRLMARLAPGVSEQQALAQVQPIFQKAAYIGLGSPMPGEKLPVLSFTPAKSFPGYDEQYGKPLRILMAMVGLVLLIALANVVMLLVARNAARQREFSLRLALGARRAELFRQLLTESLLLVTAGGALAWGFAQMASRLLARWAQIETSLAPDGTVLTFTLAALAVAAVLFGLAPLRVAMAGGAELALKTSAAASQSDAGKSRMGRMVVALQMTLCVVLLVGAGLLIRTLRNLESIDLGMRTDGLVVFGVNPEIKSVPQGVQFYQTLMGKLRALPGVEAVSVSEERLGSGWSDNFEMTVDGKLPDVSSPSLRTVRSNIVGPDFFTTLGVPVVVGRDFADSDTASSPPVGMINELFAKRFFAGKNPIGHMIGTDDARFQMRVIGVVRDHKYRSMDEDPIPMAWFDYAQIPVVASMTVEMRVHGDPMAIVPEARRVLQEMDPNMPMMNPTLQRAQFETTISNQILFARLAGFFGLLAVLLVATGLYGTLAYRVNTRTAEIGVRMALGAQRGQVLWMFVKESLVLATVGVVLGVPLAMVVGRALTASLYGIKPLDAASYAIAVCGLLLVALAAAAMPAARAASIDPMRALRTE